MTTTVTSIKMDIRQMAQKQEAAMRCARRYTNQRCAYVREARSISHAIVRLHRAAQTLPLYFLAENRYGDLLRYEITSQGDCFVTGRNCFDGRVIKRAKRGVIFCNAGGNPA